MYENFLHYKASRTINNTSFRCSLKQPSRGAALSLWTCRENKTKSFNSLGKNSLSTVQTGRYRPRPTREKLSTLQSFNVLTEKFIFKTKPESGTSVRSGKKRGKKIKKRPIISLARPFGQMRLHARTWSKWTSREKKNVQSCSTYQILLKIV